MAAWPTTLPDPLASGYQVAPVDPVIRTDMESGAGRARRRTLARNDRVTLGWTFSDAQMATFRTWLDADAAGGANWFTVRLLLGTGGATTVDARFTKVPQFAFNGNKVWSVSAEVEVR